MRNVILLTIFVLSLCAILLTTPSESQDKQLAYRMSKSANFKMIMDNGKQMANRVSKLPDSVKNKMRQIKLRMDLLQKDNGLNLYRQKDSMLKFISLIKSTSMMTPGLIKDANSMVSVYKKFNNEFPEFKNMSNQERKLVFKKAASMFLKNSNYKDHFVNL